MLQWQEKAINRIDRMSDSQLFAHILNLGDDRWKAKNHEERETIQWEWNRAITGFRSRMRLDQPVEELAEAIR